MINPNSVMLARVLHEERIAEALQSRRERLPYAPRINRQLRLLILLSNGLIGLGRKLKHQSLATQVSQELVEA